jgi:hypothetical protein
MTNYAKGKPVGDNQVPFYDSPPPVKAIAQYFTENGSTSSVVTMTQNTTAVSVTNTSANRAVFVRWVPTTDTAASVTSANFDHVVAANQTTRFVVPIEGFPETAGSVQGINRDNGLFRRVAWISQGPASIIASEYGNSNSY